MCSVRKADLKRTSFWLPEYTPEVKPDTVDKVIVV